MLNQNSARGFFLAAVALLFASNALRYPIGNLTHAGPGLFPLLVSGPLLFLAVLMILQARLTAPKLIEFNIRNIALITSALCSFVIAAEYVNVTVGIVLLVFISGLAANSYSWTRNLKIALGLIAVAFAFQKFLGLNLPLL